MVANDLGLGSVCTHWHPNTSSIVTAALPDFQAFSRARPSLSAKPAERRPPSLTRGVPVLPAKVPCSVCGARQVYRPSEVYIRLATASLEGSGVALTCLPPNEITSRSCAARDVCGVFRSPLRPSSALSLQAAPSAWSVAYIVSTEVFLCQAVLRDSGRVPGETVMGPGQWRL